MRGLDNTPQLTPGVKLGQYTLRELLGRGGTGEVWSVYSSSDQQEYALKFLRLELAADISRREAFRKEANLALRLRSPQLLRVLRYDVTPAERPFIVMELLHGEDLDALLSREGQLPIREALLVAIELLKALSELHALDLVHRDLKPSNVFLLRARGANGEPRAKLIDFGHLTVSAHQPTPSALEGTYLYMAPEQLLRRPVSAATDLYSVGALLFTMISGRPPFIITGGDKPYAHLERPAPALTDRVPQAPRALSRLLALCLDADPARRPESADALRRTLERTLDELARPAPADDGLLPAEDEAPPPPAAWSDPEAQERQEALTLEALLRGQHEELAEAWTQAITERPTFNRLQPHLLKQSAKSYLGLLAQVAGGRPTQLLAPLAERLAQSPSHLSVEFAPLLNAALLRAAARACAPYEWSEQALQDAQSALAGLLYALQQRVIDAIVTRHPADAEALLKRVFAHGAEFMAISTLSGVLLHTQPGLRSVFGEVDDSHLRQRGLFELLNGYQPILPLQRAFRELPQTPLTGPFVLSNPKARGLATQLKLSPHLFERHGQTLVLLFFEALEERSQHDEPGAPGEAGGADDLDAPQSLPWVETREISALSPVEQRQLFGFVPGEMFGEDEPTPMPSEGRLRAPEDDFAPPPSLSRAPASSLSRAPAPDAPARLAERERLRREERAREERAREERAREERAREEQAREEQAREERAREEQAREERAREERRRDALWREEQRREELRREELRRERALREELERAQQAREARDEQERLWREQQAREARDEQERLWREGQEREEQERLWREQQARERQLRERELEPRPFAISRPPLSQSSNAHFQGPSEKPDSGRAEPRVSHPIQDIYITGNYDRLARGQTPPSQPSRQASPPVSGSAPARPSSPMSPSSSGGAAAQRPAPPGPIHAPPPAPLLLHVEGPDLPLDDAGGATREELGPARLFAGAAPSLSDAPSALPPPPLRNFGAHLIAFVGIATLSWMMRDSLRELLQGAPPAAGPLTPSAPLTPPAGLMPPAAPTPAAALSRVRLVVDAEAASFFKMIDGRPVEVCVQAQECDVSVGDEVLVSSPRHHAHTLTPEALRPHGGGVWRVELAPK